MPAISPPPPTGTNTADRWSWLWRRISAPTVPCPAITSGSSNGCTNTIPVCGDQLIAVRLRLVVVVADQHHFGAQRPHRVHLDLRRGLRHHDGGLQLQLAGGVGHALGVVAGAGRDHAAGLLRLAQVGDLVVGAAQLEAEHRLRVLALQQHALAEPLRQLGRGVEPRLLGHVVDAARQDVVEELREVSSRGHGWTIVPGSRPRPQARGSRKRSGSRLPALLFLRGIG